MNDRVRKWVRRTRAEAGVPERLDDDAAIDIIVNALQADERTVDADADEAADVAI